MARSAALRQNRITALRKRDGDACWLCQQPLDFTITTTANGKIHAHSVSLDHVIERRNGGHTELQNLRLAHRQCNSLRDFRFPHTAGPLHPGNTKGHQHPQNHQPPPNATYDEQIAWYAQQRHGINAIKSPAYERYL